MANPDPVPSVPPRTPLSHRQRLRDEYGKFLKIRQSKDPTDLVDFKIHNPMLWFYAWFASLKKHSDIRVSIPFIIAFPLVMAILFGFGGYTLGKIGKIITPVCPHRIVTRLGTLYVLEVSVPAEPTFIEQLTPWLGGTTRRVVKQVALLEEKSSTITISPDHPLNFASFHGQPVAVTGTVSPCSETLTLETTENITLLKR